MVYTFFGSFNWLAGLLDHPLNSQNFYWRFGEFICVILSFVLRFFSFFMILCLLINLIFLFNL